jgi:hypothetical protein
MLKTKKVLFEVGQLLATPGALSLMREYKIDAMRLPSRHITGDWGDLSEHDKQANSDALLEGGRLFSAYGTGRRKLWVIKEADRSVTTILRPEEY